MHKIVVAAVAGVAILSSTIQAEIIDRILSVVEGQLITLSDVRAVLRLNLIDVPEGRDPTGAALDRMIDRRLTLIEVDRYLPPEPMPAALDARLEQVRARFGDALALLTVLTEVGMNYEDLRRFIRDELRIEGYMRQRFAAATGSADRERLMKEWVDGLRRRGNVVKLYLPGRLAG